jgi:hypothetical protein
MGFQMNNALPRWILGLALIGLLILAPFLYQLPSKEPHHDPAAKLPVKAAHVDHRDIVKGPFKTGQDVTRACLACHKDAAAQVMKTSHWT